MAPEPDTSALEPLIASVENRRSDPAAMADLDSRTIAAAAALIPTATYRLQFHKDFTFADAAALAPYLARLGISHVYASPFLKARPGSMHGYDTIDYRQFNPELGGEAGFRAMVAAFRDHEIGQILDFVPNHMGIGGDGNAWWQDVLEWGADSAYAAWFDIDWDADLPFSRGKVLVPMLGGQYGVVLAAGHLALRFQPETGDFAVWAYDTHKLPIYPPHYSRILGRAHRELKRLGHAFSELTRGDPLAAHRAEELKAELATQARENADVRDAVQQAVARLNGEPERLETWRELDELIQDQNWRAAHFLVAADDINYRRFFNINDLAGLRMELPTLFEHAHGLVCGLLRDGILDGLRIDHVDGLLDPKSYLERLRASVPNPFYLVVEKILARHEALPDDWPVEGTTGYDFTNQVLGWLIDPSGEPAFDALYGDFAPAAGSFNDIVHDCKIHIMTNEMASELNVLARDAVRVARQNPRTTDFTQNILRRGLKEIVACFPVYRTYVDTEGTPSDAARRDLDWAVSWARRHEPQVDPSVFDFLRNLLSADLAAEPESGFTADTVIRFAMRVQQYSGPVMAKGLEDTAFYRYNRLIALNEVGGHPDHFGVPSPAFHKANAQRAARWPHAMLTTSTHDTKRGEDVRARLAVLSEMPEEWGRQVTTWNRLLRTRIGDMEGIAPPDRNDEYLFYQLLVGSWPMEMTGVTSPDPAAVAAYAERIHGAMRKSVREAKRHSTWAFPNAAYEDAVASFTRAALDVSRPNAFLDAFVPFQNRVAALGIHNSLAQTALRLTSPGMPDTYQGSELWDLSLMDPDNRRAVDYPRHDRLLAEVMTAIETDRHAAISEMFRNWHDGRIKLALTATVLGERRAFPRLFADGSYEPLPVSGPKADQVCAFARVHGDDALLVVAARFPARLEADPGWQGTTINWPRNDRLAADCRDLLTGQTYARRDSDDLSVADLLNVLPVAVLRRGQRPVASMTSAL